MDNNLIRDRLSKLRSKMRHRGVDYYLMPTADFHSSEYVNDYFKVREYFSGFTGSNGTLVVWQEGAGLWTDGRYFIQAQRELDGTGVELFRMMEEGVPSIEEFLAERMESGQTLGFDGRVVTAREGLRYEKKFSDRGKEIKVICDRDLAEEIWTDRPAFPAGAVNVIEEKLAGRSVEEKLEAVREKLRDKGAQNLLLGKLDDLMWLFNIRGCDVECNPVAMSYGYITQDTAVLFLQRQAVDVELKVYFQEHHILLESYEDVGDYLKGLPQGQKILVDMRYCSYVFYKILAGTHTLIEAQNPTELLKAVKNPIELANMREIYLKDSVALTKFICWLKNHMVRESEGSESDGGEQSITEADAADRLEQFRREIPEFLDLSFPTIAAYQANAAMMHYEAVPENCAVLKPEGLFLVDSGGQYLGGTTDVTRTIVLGEVSEEQKKHYTMVVSAMLQLTRARWLYGCTGRNLDILARQPLWDRGLDYKCGTGHGVGYMLNVHEGPQNMRWRFAPGQAEAVLEEGMDITNEPGVYIEGSYGIRIENVMVVQKDVRNEYGQFMHFETLTWVPVDMDAVDADALTAENFEALRQYQSEVYDRISPYLDESERTWLWNETHRL